MKILSTIIHGGIHILHVNKLKHCLFFILPCFLCSCCDVAYNLTFEEQSYPFIYLKADTGTVWINCMYFQGSYYLNYGMKGEYTVNFDSLKLLTNNDNLVVRNNLPPKEVHTYKLRKEGILSIQLGFYRKSPSISITNPVVLSILPSSFITYNGQRITNDTLRVKLKFGLKRYKIDNYDNSSLNREMPSPREGHASSQASRVTKSHVFHTFASM